MPSSKIQYTSLDPQVLGGVAQEETLQEAVIQATAANNQASNIYTHAYNADSHANNAMINTATNNTASATGTLSQKLSYIINSLQNSNTGGVLRADDYLQQTASTTTTVLSSEVTATYKQLKLLGSITIPQNCIRLHLEFSIKHSYSIGTIIYVSTSPNLTSTNNSNFNSTHVFNTNYPSAPITTYTTQTYDYITYEKSNSNKHLLAMANKTLYFYLSEGQDNTAYCNSLKITPYVLTRVNSGNHVAGSVKTYASSGSSGSVLSYYPRFDRLEIVSSTYSSIYSFLSAYTYNYGGINYIFYAPPNTDYKILY